MGPAPARSRRRTPRLRRRRRTTEAWASAVEAYGPPGCLAGWLCGDLTRIRRGCASGDCERQGRSGILFGRIPAVDDDGLDFAGAGAAEGGGTAVFVGGEAGDTLLEGRKLDDDEAVELVRPLHDLKAPAPRQDLAAVLGDDRR